MTSLSPSKQFTPPRAQTGAPRRTVSDKCGARSSRHESNCSEGPGDAHRFALRGAMRQDQWGHALQAFCSLHGPEVPEAVSDRLPQGVREDFLEYADEKGKLDEVAEAMRKCSLTTRTLNAFLKHCSRRGLEKELNTFRDLGQEMNVPFNSASYCALLEGAASSEAAQQVISEAASTGTRLGRLCETAAERAVRSNDTVLATFTLRHLPENASPNTVAMLKKMCGGEDASSTEAGSEDDASSTPEAASEDDVPARGPLPEAPSSPTSRKVDPRVEVANVSTGRASKDEVFSAGFVVSFILVSVLSFIGDVFELQHGFRIGLGVAGFLVFVYFEKAESLFRPASKEMDQTRSFPWLPGSSGRLGKID